MAVLHISYDLQSPGQNYSRVEEAIKAIGTWCHALKSEWFVVTNLTPAEVRDRVRKAIDANDQLLVFAVGNGWAWTGPFDQRVTDWIKANL